MVIKNLKETKILKYLIINESLQSTNKNLKKDEIKLNLKLLKK